MEPTPEQLAAALNPTPVTYTLPSGSGFFRATGDYGSTLYKNNADGTYTPYNLLDFGKTLGTTTDAGSQANLAISALKSQYGIDYNALPEYNIGDLQQSILKSTGKTWQQYSNQFSGTLNSFLGATPTPVATSTQTTVNTQPNALAPQNEIDATRTLAESQALSTSIANKYQAGNPLGPVSAPIVTPPAPLNISGTSTQAPAGDDLTKKMQAMKD